MLHMQRLKISSEKRQTFVRGKNKQEDTRLNLVKNILEKNTNSYNLKWLNECNRLKQQVVEIQANTNILDFEHDPEDLLEFKSRPDGSYFSSESKMKRVESRASTHFDSDSFKTDKTKFTICKFNDMEALSLENGGIIGTHTKRSAHRHNTRQDVSSQLSYEFPEPCLSSPVNTELTPVTTDLKLFPISRLSTYTSMLDSTKDRKSTSLQCVGFKSVINNRLSGLASRQGPSANSLYKFSDTASSEQSQIKIEMKEDTKHDDLNGIYKTEAEYLRLNKSIRRPLKREGTATGDLVFKIRSLQAKVKYVRDQNAVNFEWTDRNVRYGDPPPRNNIARQLRILAQFAESK